MSSSIKNTLLIIIATLAGLKLFAIGINYPLNFRVRGDAYNYLAIASNFTDIASILNYAGERTIGLPLFEFVVHRTLSLFESPISLTHWVDAIGTTMFVLHITASWLFSRWTYRVKLIKSNLFVSALFLFLATFPALVGHTTTPLSDTLAIDLVLVGLTSLEGAWRSINLRSTALIATAAGVLFGLSVLVRPAYIFGLYIALLTCLVFSYFGNANQRIAVFANIVGCFLILTPYYISCSQKYETICLQSPKTVDIYLSIREGLNGARVLWSMPPESPGKFPMLPDKTMSDNYYRQCQITSILGIGDASLTGCLLTRPLTLPSLILKKWIGLFDYFRLTPYLENATPHWLRHLGRAYGAVAWLGLSFFIISCWKLRTLSGKFQVKSLVVNNMGVILLASFSIVMLAQHTAIHTEERYSFPLLPLCSTMFFAYVERFIAKYYRDGWRSLVTPVSLSILLLALYAGQIIAWDTATQTIKLQ